MSEKPDLSGELFWRQATPEDLDYVMASWLRSYQKSREFRSVEYGIFRRLYEPVVKKLLPKCTVAIASLPDLPATVIGWVALEDDKLHFVYTKARFRHMGVARWMVRDLKEKPVTYSHKPPIAAFKLLGPDWKYDPMSRFEVPL